MATVNVTDYGAVPNDETHDCGPDFAAAIAAAGNKGTVVLPAGAWHVFTYPVIHGAFPTVQATSGATLEYHLACDYYGTVADASIQSFVLYQDGFGVPYGWTLEGLGVRP